MGESLLLELLRRLVGRVAPPDLLDAVVTLRIWSLEEVALQVKLVRIDNLLHDVVAGEPEGRLYVVGDDRVYLHVALDVVHHLIHRDAEPLDERLSVVLVEVVDDDFVFFPCEFGVLVDIVGTQQLLDDLHLGGESSLTGVGVAGDEPTLAEDDYDVLSRGAGAGLHVIREVLGYGFKVSLCAVVEGLAGFDCLGCVETAFNPPLEVPSRVKLFERVIAARVGEDIVEEHLHGFRIVTDEPLLGQLRGVRPNFSIEDVIVFAEGILPEYLLTHLSLPLICIADLM